MKLKLSGEVSRRRGFSCFNLNVLIVVKADISVLQIEKCQWIFVSLQK